MDRYAVIGHPVEHSRSPEIHALFARQTGEHLVYDRLPTAPEVFEATAQRFFEAGGRGLNVTLPFKQRAAALADRLTPRAEQAGAVNTLMATDTGLLGDNTDGAGLIADVSGRLAFELVGRHVLILGAGGAVRGVVPALLAAGVAQVTIANRSLDKAQWIADACQPLGTVNACSLDAAPSTASLVINAISAGLSGNMPDVPNTVLGQAEAVYDMIYADQPTPFLRWAEAQGVAGVDGFGMLVEQAAASFALWRGVTPRTHDVIQALLRGGSITAS